MFKYVNRKLDAVFINNTDPLNKVRAQILVYALFIGSFIIAITLPGMYAKYNFSIVVTRSIIMIIIQSFLIWLLLSKKKWKLVAHCCCILVASLIWSNIFIPIQGKSIISLQWMLLLIIMGYYLLGTKWGVFYSTTCLLFVLCCYAVYGSNAMTNLNTDETDTFAFVSLFSFNFLLIIYAQYHFYNAFNSTINKLNEKQVAEKLLNEKLTEAIIIAEQSAKAKTYFISTISHELRTPLNGVIGMTDILLLDNPREDQAESLSMLKFSANNLLTLINDVLDINKIESGKIIIEKTPFKIYPLIKNIYAGFKITANEKNIKFILDIDQNLAETTVIGDPTRLTQILVNLIDNALKFTAFGQVSVVVKALQMEENKIKFYFCISDTGIGIPLNKQDLIFESFSQASTSTTRKYGGTGLGLAIVKNLLELQHSSISIKSRVGEGTSFDFELSYELYDLRNNKTLDYKNIKETDISNLNVLVAEDNQINTLLMRKLLAKWNIMPDYATNGIEAVDAFKAKHYDLILMDIHMPIMDGYEATAIIRNDIDQKKAQVPIIALTASSALDVRNKITAAGINDYVSKPFNTEELRGKLEEIATKKQ